nr:unnamed protein product [Callosobruchus analis]
MVDNDSERSESPKDFQTFIGRLKKRKSNTDRMDNSTEEKKLRLEEQPEQRGSKSFHIDKNQSKNEEFWISRYVLKCNKSTGDIPVNRKVLETEKHNSLPVTREEVKKGIKAHSGVVHPSSSSKKVKSQVVDVLKKKVNEKSKPSQQVKPKSLNINLNYIATNKSKPNDKLSISKVLEKRKCAMQPKNYIDDKQIVKGILDKLVKRGSHQSKTNSFVKEDTVANIFSKTEHQVQTLSKKYVFCPEQNQHHDQATANKCSDMFDHHLPNSKQLQIGPFAADKIKTDIEKGNELEESTIHKLPGESSVKNCIADTKIRGTNTEPSPPDKRIDNNVFSWTISETQIGIPRDHQSTEHNLTSKRKTCHMDGSGEICKLISRLTGQREITEQGDEEIQKLISKLKNQKEEANYSETTKHTLGTTDKNDCCNSDTSGSIEVDERENSQRKLNSSTLKQLTLLQTFNKADSGLKQDNSGMHKYNNKLKYSLMCSKSRNVEISEETDLSSSITSELKQKCDNFENSKSHTVQTVNDNQVLEKRQAVPQYYGKPSEKKGMMYMFQDNSKFTDNVTNRQQMENIFKDMKSLSKIRQSTPNSLGVDLGKEHKSREEEKSGNSMTPNTCDDKTKDDDIHHIIRRLATATEKVELNNDRSKTNSQHLTRFLENTELRGSVPNAIANNKNTLANENDNLSVTYFKNRSEKRNMQSSKAKKIVGILQSNDCMKTSTNSNFSPNFDPHAECSNKSLHDVLKVATERDEIKNGQKDKGAHISNVIAKLENNSFENLIRSGPVYSQNQVNAAILKPSTKQMCIRDNVEKTLTRVVQTLFTKESDINTQIARNTACESLGIRQKNAVVAQDLTPKDVMSPGGKVSFEVLCDGKFVGRTKPDDGLEKLKLLKPKYSEEIKQKMGNSGAKIFDDLETNAEKQATDTIDSSKRFSEQTKILGNENLRDQNVKNASSVDNDTVSSDDQQKLVSKILFEMSCKKSCEQTGSPCRRVSQRDSNSSVCEGVKRQDINLETKNEVQSITGVESEDKIVSQSLLLKRKQNLVVNSFHENEQNKVTSDRNITEDQIITNMLYGKTCHESRSQSDITGFKDTFMFSTHSLTNHDHNIRSESYAQTLKSGLQLNHYPEDDLSEELWVPNSFFLKQRSETSEPSQCKSSGQNDGNNDIGKHDLSNHSFFEPVPHFGNPIQPHCLHKNSKEFLDQNMNTDENNNLIDSCDTHNNILLSAEKNRELPQTETMHILDKDERNLGRNDTILKRTQISSSKANELLADEEINTILTKNYQRCMRSKENNPSQTRDDAISKLLKKTEGQESKSKGGVKKYRKGKLKIYRLKKMKKPNENLDLEDVLKKLTQDYQESARCSSPSESFVSTPSSYRSVNTLRSETLSTGDTSLLHVEDSSDLTEVDQDEIKIKIQNIFLQIFNDLTSGRRAALKFRKRCYENCILKEGRLQLKPEGEALESVLSSTTRSQMTFKLVICIMKKIQLKDMINGQGVVDRAINLVSCLLNVGMWALNIIAQKGLIFGNLKIMLSSGETINCNVPGTLIPQDINDIVELHSDAYFILVVEKEAIFQKLLEEDVPNKLTRPFIMITGKGFPDLNTQLFLRKLWIIMSIPVFILVDADPHGINIMLNYRFGSVANAHVSHHLAVPKAKWLGVLPSEITMFNVKKEAMTTNEQKMVDKLLNTPYMKDNPGIVEELKILQKNNLKAGIEGLIKTDVFLSQVYLPHKFLHRNFI